MKHFAFFLIGLLAVLATGCGFKSTETPLNKNLTCYTALGKADDDTLRGVKNNQGEILVEPADYTSITVDEHFIFCARANGQVNIFGLDGTPCGVFDVFERLKNEDNDYYHGQFGETTTYYFPGKAFISCKESHITKEALFIATDSIWTTYSFTGEKLWELPPNAMLLKGPLDLTIAVPGKGKKPTCKFYNVKGEVVNLFSASMWKKFQKQLTDQQNIGTLQIYQVKTLELVQNIPNFSRTPTKEEIYNMIHSPNLCNYYA